jgi:hypothetical protein
LSEQQWEARRGRPRLDPDYLLSAIHYALFRELASVVVELAGVASSRTDPAPSDLRLITLECDARNSQPIAYSTPLLHDCSR